jgi:hypothetical protein
MDLAIIGYEMMACLQRLATPLVALSLVGACASPLPEWEERDPSTMTDPGDQFALLDAIRPLSGREYAIGTLATGESQYVDREYTFAQIPPELDGLPVIRTANDDSGAKRGTDDFLSFWLSAEAEVFVLHDVRIEPKPSWLDEWQATGEVVTNDEYGVERSFDVYRGAFAPGEVLIGSNLIERMRSSMYGVAVRPLGE